jgi:hypothetical protein
VDGIRTRGGPPGRTRSILSTSRRTCCSPLTTRVTHSALLPNTTCVSNSPALLPNASASTGATTFAHPNIFSSSGKRAAGAKFTAAAPLAQYVRGSEHNPGDKREHAGKQHNVDDELDHHTPPKLRPERTIPATTRNIEAAAAASMMNWSDRGILYSGLSRSDISLPSNGERGSRPQGSGSPKNKAAPGHCQTGAASRGRCTPDPMEAHLPDPTIGDYAVRDPWQVEADLEVATMWTNAEIIEMAALVVAVDELPWPPVSRRRSNGLWKQLTMSACRWRASCWRACHTASAPRVPRLSAVHARSRQTSGLVLRISQRAAARSRWAHHPGRPW